MAFLYIKKSPKVIKKVGKILWRLIKYSALLLLLLVVVLSIPTVQTSLAERLTSSLNDDYGTNIKVEKVDLSFLGSVRLRGVQIRDHHNDTLIFVEKLSTSILNFKKLSSDGNLNLGDATLTDAKVHMKIYKDETDDNMSIFIDSFDDGKPSDNESPFILKSKNIYIENLDYSYIDENQTGEKLLFSATNVGGCLRDFALVGSQVSLKGRGLYLIDNRGLDVRNLTTDFLYTKSRMEFYNTTLATNNYSKVQGDLVFTYERKDFSDFLNKVNLDAKLSKSILSVKDLKKFYSGFSGADKFKLDTKLRGTLNNLQASNLTMSSQEGIKVRGDFRFRNSFDLDRGFGLKATIDEITANYTKLNKLLPNLLNDKLKKTFNKVGDFEVEGVLTLTPTEMDAVLDVQTEMGGTISNLHLTDITDVKNAKYEGDVQFVNFDLGKLVNNPLLGKVSFKTTVGGSGLSSKNIVSGLKGKIKNLDFNGYTYRNIDVNGIFQNRKFDGFVKVNDDNFKMVFEGLADFSSVINEFDFKADVEKIDLKKTNLFTRDSISEMKGKIRIDFKGNDIDDIVGKAIFKDFSYKNQKQVYEFKKFELDSKVQDSIRTISLNSEQIIKGELKGKFLFEELLPITQNALWSTYSNYEPVKVTPHQFFNFDFVINNQIVGIFFPEIDIEKNAEIKGKIDANTNTVRMLATASKVSAYNTVVDSLRLRIDNKNFLYHTHLEIGKLANKKYQISKLNLINRTKNDTLFFKSAFKGGEKETEDFNLDFFYTFNEEKKSVLGIQKSIFNIKGNDWVINPENNNNNKLTYDSSIKKFEFFPILVTSIEGQKIEFNGNLTDNTKELQAKLTNINLKNIVPKVDNLDLQGTLNGEMSILEKNGFVLPIGDVHIEGLVVNDFSQGNVKMKIKGDNSYDKYDVDFSIRDYNFDNLKAKGKIDFSSSEPTLDLSINLKKYELHGFSDFGDGVISNIRGTVSGEFNAKGKLFNPIFNGKLSFENTGFTFPYLNIDFDIAENANMYLKNRSFYLDNIVLKDTKYKTKGFLSGSISHRNFKDWYLNLDINSKNLLVLDTQETEDELYYGTGFFNGRGTIQGKTSNLTIDINGKTEKGTRFVIPLSDVTMANNYKLIKFEKPIVKDEVKNKKGKTLKGIEGLNLLIDLDVTKDAVAQIVIDKVNRSDLEGRGEGNLDIAINTKGRFTINGDLIIDSGIYNFRYTGIPKKFQVQKGGTISWSGDPFRAELDLVAFYQARANPAQLLDNIVSNRKIPVNLYTKITGELFDSKQEFDIKIPSADSSVASELEFRFENDNNSKMLNFASLLLGNTFYDDERAGSFASSFATSTASDVLSNILSDIINSDDGRLKLNLGYTQADKTDIEELVYDDQVDVSVIGTLTDRVIFNGKVGLPVGAANIQSSVVGEAKLEVLLNDAGTLRWNIFNKPNDIQYSIDEQGYTQGTGLSYQVNFNTLSQLFEKFKSKKKKKPKKGNDTIVKYKMINFTPKEKVKKEDESAN